MSPPVTPDHTGQSAPIRSLGQLIDAAGVAFNKPHAVVLGDLTPRIEQALYLAIRRDVIESITLMGNLLPKPVTDIVTHTNFRHVGPMPGSLGKDLWETTEAAAEMISSQRPDIIVKASIRTDVLLRALLRAGRSVEDQILLSHVSTFSLPASDGLYLLTDSAVLPTPNVPEMLGCIENLIELGQVLGLPALRVALLAASEGPDASDSVISRIGRVLEGLPPQQEHIHVDGPLALDAALSRESARSKGLGSSPVAGRANAFVSPDLVTANVLIKSITHFAGGSMAGVVMGARWPIALTSRSAPVSDRLYSIGLAALVHARKSPNRHYMPGSARQ